MRLLALFVVLPLIACDRGPAPTPADVAGVYAQLGDDGRPIGWEEYPGGILFWEFSPDGTCAQHWILTSSSRRHAEGDTLVSPASFSVSKGKNGCVEVHFEPDFLAAVEGTAVVCGGDLILTGEDEGEVLEEVFRKRQ